MSDKKLQDAVAGEPEKDVATDTQVIESASPERDSAELEGSDLESSELESSELEGSELESFDLENSELESFELEGSELESLELESSKLQSSELKSSAIQSPNPPNADPASAPVADGSASLEQLLPSVLEIAEATNNAADVSRQSSVALKKA